MLIPQRALLLFTAPRKISDIKLSEYSKRRPNKTRRPWASRSGARRGGRLRFPNPGEGPESRGRCGVCLPSTALNERDTGRFCFGETPENIQPPGSTDTSVLSHTVPQLRLTDTHTYTGHTRRQQEHYVTATKRCDLSTFATRTTFSMQHRACCWSGPWGKDDHVEEDGTAQHISLQHFQ